MERLRKVQSQGMLAAGMLLAAFFVLVEPAAAASCTWGGTPSVGPPSVTFLRAYREPLRAPGRVAIDTSGRVYTTDPRMGRVIVRDAYGRLLSVMRGLHIPLGIAVDASSKIYIAEQGRGSVSVFDAYGTRRYKLGAGDGEFLLPNAVAIDPGTRRIYVSDSGAHTVKVYSSGGIPEFTFGGLGTADGQFDFPAGVYVSDIGEVFVTDQNNDRVQVFDGDGTFLRCFGSRSSFRFSRKFGGLLGVTGDSLGRVYVADTFQGHIKIFDEAGALLTTLGSFGTGPGQLRTPIDLAIDPFNRLFVSSVNNARVEIFGLDDFSDPRVVPAVVDVKRDTLRRSSKKKSIAVYIEIPGYSLDGVTGVTANGIPALSSPWAIGDYDNDEIPDLKVKFDRDALLATVPDGQSIVVVSGQFTNGNGFEGVDTVRVISKLKARRGKARKVKAKRARR